MLDGISYRRPLRVADCAAGVGSIGDYYRGDGVCAGTRAGGLLFLLYFVADLDFAARLVVLARRSHIRYVCRELAENEVGAAAEHHIRGHERIYGRKSVGKRQSVKAPFVSRHRLHERVVDRRMNFADSVVGRHGSAAAVFLHSNLEGLEVDLASSLLGNVGMYVLTVVLVFVKRIVLNGTHDTLSLHAAGNRACHVTCKVSVLCEILARALTERSTVNVGCGCVPAVHAVVDRRMMSYVRACVAALEHKVFVPSAGIKRFGGPVVVLIAADSFKLDVYLARAVHITSLYLSDSVKSQSLIAAVAKEGLHLIKRKLVEKRIPLRIVIIETYHISEPNPTLALLKLGKVCIGISLRPLFAAHCLPFGFAYSPRELGIVLIGRRAVRVGLLIVGIDIGVLFSVYRILCKLICLVVGECGDVVVEFVAASHIRNGIELRPSAVFQALFACRDVGSLKNGHLTFFIKSLARTSVIAE